jgi:2-polyprenyl-3-methyl-5-hydroxy-6-metoxy-1,4-benzoquinol methylase
VPFGIDTMLKKNATAYEQQACPVCGKAAAPAYSHADAIIFRCPACTHAFSALDTLSHLEDYGPAYYEETHKNWFLHPNRDLFSLIAGQLEERGVNSVIDIGCGKGDFLRHIHLRIPGARLIGVDLSDNAPEPGITYWRGDILNAPIEEQFDAVVSLAVIEHVPDVQGFLRRLSDLCKPGGTIIVMTLNDGGLLYRTARLGKALGVSIAFDRVYDAHHLHHFTTRSLSRLIQGAGLRIDRVHHHNAPIAAMDIPAGNALAGVVLTWAVALVFAIGRMTQSCYLQTAIARKPAASDDRGSSS